MALHYPFDLKEIFVVDLAGNPEIFTFLSMLALSFLLGRFNFSNKINLSLFALFTVMMSIYMPKMFVLATLLAGVVTFWAATKWGR